MLHEAAYAPALWIIAIVALISARLSGNSGIARSVAVILLNWCAGIAYNILTGEHHGWMFNIIIDTSASVAILWRPAGKMQALLGVSYCTQIAMHGGYGAAKLFGSADPDKYYAAITLVAWIQLLLIGGWCVGIWAGDGIRRRLGGYSPLAAAARGGNLAEP